MVNLNAARVVRKGNTIFIILPPEAWRPIPSGCSCHYCSSSPLVQSPAYWDTLGLGSESRAGEGDHAYSCHYPELHGVLPKRKEF